MVRNHEIEERTEIRDGMRIAWDMPIPMDDGIVLRCDVFRPVAEGRYPVIMTYGAYGKSLAFQDKYRHAWERMAAEHPDAVAGPSTHARTGKWSIPRSRGRPHHHCEREPKQSRARTAPHGRW